MGAPTDVLIVGAGPAGSIAALTLARAGVRVRLIDRASFPRDKLCGDTVNPGSLSLLDSIGLGNAVRGAALPVYGMIVTGPAGAAVTADYGGDIAGAALSRRILDAMLVDAAVAAGAVFDDGVAVREPIVSPAGSVAGVNASGRDGVAHALAARIVIAADGRASRLGSALGLTSFAARPRRWAFGAYYEGVEGLTARGEMHVRTDGYIGVAPLPGGLANVCVVREWRDVRGARRTDLASHADAVARDPMLRDRFARARRVSDVTALGPLAVEARRSGVAGLLLAGDAAGFVDPMTGDGLRFALRSGMLAAEFAMRELEIGRPQHAALHAARRREFSAKWRINRALRALVGSPLGVTLASTIGSRWNAPVQSIVTLAGDVALARDLRAQERPVAPEHGPRIA